MAVNVCNYDLIPRNEENWLTKFFPFQVQLYVNGDRDNYSPYYRLESTLAIYVRRNLCAKMI